METIPVFIGYDPREAVAYHVCCQSILEHTHSDVSFHPVSGERRDGSNDFIYARFLVPWRMGYRGRAIFLDGDMVVRRDIAELWNAREWCHVGAHVVKHEYRTKYPVKYLGNPNNDYPRKNWSSVIVWNCGYFPNRRLTPEFVAAHDGAYLHRFAWLKDDEIGALDPAWNKLVLEQTLHEEDKLRHYTVGLPAFSEYSDCEGAEEWHDTLARALAPMSR